MIVIAARFLVRPDSAGRWLDLVVDLTSGSRNEPGCRWFDWWRSTDDPNEYFLSEGFDGPEALADHARREYYTAAVSDLPKHLAATPKVISATVNQDGWADLVQMAVPGA